MLWICKSLAASANTVISLLTHVRCCNTLVRKSQLDAFVLECYGSKPDVYFGKIIVLFSLFFFSSQCILKYILTIPRNNSHYLGAAQLECFLVCKLFQQHGHLIGTYCWDSAWLYFRMTTESVLAPFLPCSFSQSDVTLRKWIVLRGCKIHASLVW